MTQQQYDRVCKGEFDKINSKLDALHNRLFLDNGSPCIQTRLDRNERMWKVTMWIVTVVCAASIVQSARAVYDHLNPHDNAVVSVE